MTEFERPQAEWAERKRARDEATSAIRKDVFDALAALGAMRLDADFDGCGDTGQIENTAIKGADTLTWAPTGILVLGPSSSTRI